MTYEFKLIVRRKEDDPGRLVVKFELDRAWAPPKIEMMSTDVKTRMDS